MKVEAVRGQGKHLVPGVFPYAGLQFNPFSVPVGRQLAVVAPYRRIDTLGRVEGLVIAHDLQFPFGDVADQRHRGMGQSADETGEQELRFLGFRNDWRIAAHNRAGQIDRYWRRRWRRAIVGAVGSAQDQYDDRNDAPDGHGGQEGIGIVGIRHPTRFEPAFDHRKSCADQREQFAPGSLRIPPWRPLGIAAIKLDPRPVQPVPGIVDQFHEADRPDAFDDRQRFRRQRIVVAAVDPSERRRSRFEQRVAARDGRCQHLGEPAFGAGREIDLFEPGIGEQRQPVMFDRCQFLRRRRCVMVGEQQRFERVEMRVDRFVKGGEFRIGFRLALHGWGGREVGFESRLGHRLGRPRQRRIPRCPQCREARWIGVDVHRFQPRGIGFPDRAAVGRRVEVERRPDAAPHRKRSPSI
ncbi:hypothetical protein [Sphingomonas sp. T9W2]|uniref:hypothetical protein n=1 Tax=Sphingomonas sp. T9W2 TaxID=3143183 RepID=UPI0031F4D946